MEKPLAALLLLPLALLLPACLGGAVKKEYPEKRAYVLDVARPGEPATSNADSVLQVRRFAISEGFQGKGLVYRRGEHDYETDFYHELFVPPSANVTEEALAWLSASGLFGSVVDAGSYLFATHVLEGRVVALYGDYRGEPGAVLELQVFLVDSAGSPPRVLFQRDYRESVPLEGEEPEQLVAGWNRALASVLGALERDLGAALERG